MRSESKKTNSKEQREKDVFFSAGQNTTFLAGTSRTVCPLWQYPACLDVHKCVFTCNPVWLHNLPPREFGKKDMRDFRNCKQSAAYCFSHTISSTIWSSWPLGKQPKKKNHPNCWSGTQPTISEMQQGSASVASLYLPTFIKQLNSWVHDQNTEPAPSLNLFLLFVFQRTILNLCQMHLVSD